MERRRLFHLAPLPRGEVAALPRVRGASHQVPHFPAALTSILPMRLACSANQTLPSGPAHMPNGCDLGVGTSNSVTLPSGVIRPTLPVPNAANHTFPSPPAATPTGRLPFGTGNSFTSP